MSNDQSVRRILPQNSEAGSFSSFVPQQYQQRETQKNYVFVDEHNRHKRLKVMRACEGCRRRKIKCDAATTNTWPCSACVRLKLQCVRPNGQFDGMDSGYDAPGSSFSDSNLEEAFRAAQAPLQQGQMMATASKPTTSNAMYAPQSAYQEVSNVYQTVPYSEGGPTAAHDLHYTTVPPPAGMVDSAYSTQNVFATPPMQPAARADSSPGAYSQDSYQQQDLADLLGSLKVNEAGTAPYLRNKVSMRQEEEPAVEDADDYRAVLPPMATVPGLKIRIPPELMPDDETVLHYFDLYFMHVHPYVPVLSKTLLYQQWHTNRESISPLILEAIFAISGRLADEPAQGQQWLAMADNHADSFMDVPRLSTLQALLILLKAREAAPKRGYFFRSWMTVVQCVEMGKDLGLDEHYADHKAGNPCGSNPIECQLKTRIWQTIFVVEVMIGSPQGRTDLAVKLETVNFSITKPIQGEESSEYNTARGFTFFARLVAKVSRMNSVYARIKKKKDWGLDPEFIQLNPSLKVWLDELPPDMSLTFPADGSAPWISSAFIGNMHSYYYLALILLHRPQLNFLDPNGMDGQWKHHMMICYESAKSLCRLQESVLNNFGLQGLQAMQRGFSFTVYCGLTCIVLHLVAITSPDPDLNSDARQYFTRHMRILETVTAVWPMADLQKQIDAVREAFSADIRKPFVLKPSFPYGSPHSSNHSSPPRSNQGYRPSNLNRTGALEQQLDPNIHSQSMLVMPASTSQASGISQSMSMAEAPTWNPTRIFEQWNSSFGTPAQSAPAAPPQASSLNAPPGAPEVPTLQQIQAVNAAMTSGAQTMQQPQYAPAPVPTFVTPAMWQESVASVYEGGLKRAWDYDGGGGMMKRR